MAFEFDLRWRFACGGLDVDGGGFCHTVLVGMRARLAASEQPRRIFDAVLVAARQAGALSQRRVLDSVPIYDAVATQDTATMLHRAIRAVLAAASDAALGMAAALRGDYASGAKAHCDWDDPRARQELVDRLGADAAAVLAALEGRKLDGALSEAAEFVGRGGRPGPVPGQRRALHDRSARGQGPGPVHCGPRCPPRPQEHRETLSTATRATPRWTPTPN